MEQQTGSKLGKEYVQAIFCHPAYLTYMQSTSWEIPGWMKHKLEARLLGEISITSDMQMTLMAESEEELKNLLMKVKEKSWKCWLKTQHSKKEDHGNPSHHFMGKQRKQWLTLFFWAPKSLQMVTATMKLKDAYSLEEKLWPA